MGFLCPTRPEIKNRSRRRSLFRGSKTPEGDIDNLTSYPAPNNYMSLHSKIEPAAINIERDITKCLTCHGFFELLKKEKLSKISYLLNVSSSSCIKISKKIKKII